jgi:hypothetical protein
LERLLSVLGCRRKSVSSNVEVALQHFDHPMANLIARTSTNIFIDSPTPFI